MKTQTDCWQALIDGKTLVHKNGCCYKRVDGGIQITNCDTGKTFMTGTAFISYEEYEIQAQVPQINPLHIPLGWWVVMDENEAWFASSTEPSLRQHDWAVDCRFNSIRLRLCIIYDGDWKEAKFTRQQIADTWEGYK